MGNQEDAYLADAPNIAGERSILKAVAMPTEHGGWSLTLEPVVLALVVSWSWSGLALGFAAMLAFIARTPLKIVLGDLWRNRWLERSGVAARVASIEVFLFIALIVYAIFEAENNFLIPLLIALPLVAIQLYFDIRSKSRRLLPELCGTVGIGSVASAIVLANGVANTTAYALWIVVATRGVAAIPYARTQVFRKRGRPVKVWHSDLAQLFAGVSVIIAYLFHIVPLAPTIAIVIIAIFNIIAIRNTPLPAKIIGLQQMFFGITLVVITAIAVLV